MHQLYRPSRLQRQAAYIESWDSSEFPIFRERVIATGEGEVLRGHVAVANAIVESWCADNPVLFVALIERWIRQAQAADDADKDWHRRWEDRLAYNPKLTAALETKNGPAVVCQQAGLTAFQTRAIELMLEGKTKTEIGVLLGMSRQGATKHLDNALEKILAMDRDATTG